MPIGDINPLIDHLIGAREQHRRNFKGERLRGFEVDHQIEARWLLHGFRRSYLSHVYHINDGTMISELWGFR